MSKCKAPGCTKYSSYGLPGQVSRDYCKTHKTEEMICNRTRTKPECKEEGCTTCPSYGLPGGRKEYCSVHRLDIMVYLCKVIIPICEEDGCDVVASFNFVAEKKRRYCNAHKLDGMVRVGQQKECAHEGCTKHPHFGFPGASMDYCSAHKQDGMINLRKTCEDDECMAKPRFGYSGGSPTHCAVHKSDDMMDLITPTCEFEDCTVIPYFGYPRSKPTRCATHRLEGMEDIKTKRCEMCEVQASFGFPDAGVQRCAAHATSDMVSHKGARCTDESCTTTALFGLVGDPRPTRCSRHQFPGMRDIVNPRCSSCDLMKVAKRGGLCSYCDPDSNRRQRTKENQVAAVLKEELPDVDFVQNQTDREIMDCAGRSFRPDFMVKLDTHIIVNEVDEMGHRSYEVSCEIARLISLAMSGNGLPMVVIRFNPDNFRVDGKLKKTPIKTRHAALVDRVKYHLENVPTKLLTVEYMYYDSDRERELQEHLDAIMSRY